MLLSLFYDVEARATLPYRISMMSNVTIHLMYRWKNHLVFQKVFPYSTLHKANPKLGTPVTTPLHRRSLEGARQLKY